jgi:hypothetical protein
MPGPGVARVAVNEQRVRSLIDVLDVDVLQRA